MTNPIRFGILSFAHYHANFWAQAMNEAADATLVGIWDDNPERGKEAAEQYGTRFFPDRAALLRECDAAGITSETAYHAPLVEDVAAAGVHILLEKPMALNLDECRRIRDAVNEAGVVFMQNFPKRYDPVNHELVELVRSGALGTISLVRVRHAHYHLRELGQSAAEPWIADPVLSGGGTLMDEGVHGADFLLWLLGEPSHVFAATSSTTLGLPIDDTAVALFTFPSGALAELSTSGTLLAAEESIEVYGTNGSAILSGVDLASRDFSHLPYLKLFRYGDERGEWEGSSTVPYFKQGNFHQQGPLYFIRCVRGEVPPLVSLEEGWKSSAIIQAAYRAAETGSAQEIDYSLGD